MLIQKGIVYRLSMPPPPPLPTSLSPHLVKHRDEDTLFMLPEVILSQFLTIKLSFISHWNKKSDFCKVVLQIHIPTASKHNINCKNVTFIDAFYPEFINKYYQSEMMSLVQGKSLLEV